jgi:hypothetical protein
MLQFALAFFAVSSCNSMTLSGFATKFAFIVSHVLWVDHGDVFACPSVCFSFWSFEGGCDEFPNLWAVFGCAQIS